MLIMVFNKNFDKLTNIRGEIVIIRSLNRGEYWGEYRRQTTETGFRRSYPVSHSGESRRSPFHLEQLDPK
jgi:hypothetical protein